MTKAYLSLILLGNVLLLHIATAIYCDGAMTDAAGSGASDVVAVRQNDGSIHSTPFHLQIGRFSSFFSYWFRRPGLSVQIVINGKRGPMDLKVSEMGATCFERSSPDHSETWTPSEWDQVELSSGENNASYRIPSLRIEISFQVYLYKQEDKLVISDVDGTITESDLEGQIFSQLGRSVHYFDVIPLFKAIRMRGYKIIYLTARSIAQDETTRYYLFNKLGLLGLPKGPLLMSPKPAAETLYESTVGTPRYTKASNLNDLLNLFNDKDNVVKGAYGNVQSDSEAYQDVGISKSLIYLIEYGNLRREDRTDEVSSYHNEIRKLDETYPRLG
ncbi:phosphatidate phosphatase LPIN2 [Lepeophtheirus salmonis]|uniref:phosphatidate phosphatase LPIN2 n=1 Tax=Lepeophtheirus salmonis TaxID=72036 RepID=UPI001AE54637|nr:phosphatidate phosphatase LPIN2-like [Lepeophtheirus salmonis]